MRASQVEKSQSSLSNCEGKLWIALKPLQCNWGSSHVAQGSYGFSRIVAGTSGFLLSCNGNLGEPLELHKGSQASFPVAWGNLGLVLCCCRGTGPHLGLRGGSHVSLRVAGISGILSSWDRDLSDPLELPQGSQASFLVVRRTLGFLSRCCRGIRPRLELRQEIWGLKL